LFGAKRLTHGKLIRFVGRVVHRFDLWSSCVFEAEWDLLAPRAAAENHPSENREDPR